MKLFDQYNINGKLKVSNCVMVPPIVTRLATVTGDVTDRLVERYLQYARGGAGFVITDPLSVIEQKSGQLLRVSDDRFIPGLHELAQNIHGETEAKIGVQVIHFLKISRSGYRQKVEDLPLNEVKEIPGLFSRAACRARQALRAQMRCIYETVQGLLEKAGATFDDVVKTTDYITPQAVQAYAETAEIRREFFKTAFPAATGVVVHSLLRPDWLIEIEFTAVID